MYEGQASYFLPSGVLEYFELTDYAEVTTRDKGVLYTTELHIYLDERDNRTPEMAYSVSAGFGEESSAAPSGLDVVLRYTGALPLPVIRRPFGTFAAPTYLQGLG